MIRYGIFASERTASNLLCDLLAQTGKAGIRDVMSGHIFIGHGEGLAQKTYRDLERYFTAEATTGEVQGCKLSFDYLDVLRRWMGFAPIRALLHSFTHCIWLRRQDEIAQAVSLHIAASEDNFSSRNTKPVQPLADYDYDHIAYRLGQIRAHNARFATFFEHHGIEPLKLDSESVMEDYAVALETVFQFLGVLPPAGGFEAIQPTLQRQRDPRKRRYVERFHREYHARQGEVLAL